MLGGFNVNTSEIIKHYKSLLNLPLLTKEEELELCLLAASGDDVAKNTLFEHNTRLVLNIVKQYQTYTLDAEDLFQVGLCGLLTAIEKFDPSKNTRFTTYAYYWIRQKIERTIADEEYTIRLPNSIHTLISKITRFEKQYQSQTGTQPTPQFIAEQLNISEQQVISCLRERGKRKISLDGTYGDEADDTFYNTISAADYRPDVDPTEFDVQRDQEAVIQTLMCCLTPRQSDVICKRFGLMNEAPETLETIAFQYGITRERVRQLESEAIDTMKNYALKNNIRFELH